jgi:hypothetical protein
MEYLAVKVVAIPVIAQVEPQDVEAAGEQLRTQ